jgi:uncharacterized lipoprotein YddW (UPF0748 family)
MKKYLKYLIALSLAAFMAACDTDNTGGLIEIDPLTPPVDVLLPKKELRAVWIASYTDIDWPKGDFTADGQKQFYINYLDRFVEANVNAVFMQIRPTADAFYNSPYEPWSKYITGTAGKDPGYDVLKFMIDEAHARGLEFHAWMNPYRIATKAADAAFPELDPKIPAALTKDYSTIRIYNPAMPEVQQRVADIVKDVITKYDVDGIVWDDYFYPDLGNVNLLNDQADYVTYGAGYKTIEQFRIANVNKVIQLVKKTIVENKPGVVFTLSPTSSYSYNEGTLFADAKAWCRGGWCDVIMPQIYQSTDPDPNNKSSFNSFLKWWTNISGSQAVTMVAYGMYKFGVTAEIAKDPDFGSADEFALQLELANAEPGIKGGSLYNASSFTANRLGVTDTLKNHFYKHPALVPVLGRRTLTADPQAITIKLEGQTLTWNGADGMRFAVYKLDENKVGTIVKIIKVGDDKVFALPDKGDYCVTAVDKDNMESPVSNIVSYQ